jgi:hypothetical protein
MKSVTAALAAGALLFGTHALAQDVLVHIDGLLDCLDTDTMTGGKAAFTIPPGQYWVKLVDNTLRCGNIDKKFCHIDAVTFNIEDLSPMENSAEWGVAVHRPIEVGVYGKTDAPGSAFVIDTHCADNTGSVTLQFHRIF